MPADGHVNVTKQSIYAAIPFLDLYSAYHIKKLRRYLLYTILIIVIPQTAIEFIIFEDFLDMQYAYTAFLNPESTTYFQSWYVILWIPIGMIFSIMIIRYWSIEWNYKTDISDI